MKSRINPARTVLFLDGFSGDNPSDVTVHIGASNPGFNLFKELLVEENNELNDKIEKLNNRIQSNDEKLSFYEEYAVCVDEQSNYYHTYGKCDYFDDSLFWIYNIEAAEDYGYKPCPACFNWKEKKKIEPL